METPLFVPFNRCCCYELIFVPEFFFVICRRSFNQTLSLSQYGEIYKWKNWTEPNWTVSNCGNKFGRKVLKLASLRKNLNRTARITFNEWPKKLISLPCSSSSHTNTSTNQSICLYFNRSFIFVLHFFFKFILFHSIYLYEWSLCNQH